MGQRTNGHRREQLQWLLGCVRNFCFELLPGPIVVSVRRKRLHRQLQLLHDVLAQTPMAGRYWLDGGLLLGWAREGDVLRHDTKDVDFAFLADDFLNMVSAIPSLAKAGFNLMHAHRDNEGELVVFSFLSGGVQFDFLKVSPKDNQWVYRGIFTSPIQVTFERPSQELEEVEIFGRRWLKPKDTDLTLSALYGDWKTPQFDWMTDRDSPSIVAREAWEWTSAYPKPDGNFEERVDPKPRARQPK